MSIRLQRHPLSGHSHRAQLALPLLAVPHEGVDVDLMKGAHKVPAFVKQSPFGQVPVLDDNGTVVFDSNDILMYLATKYDAEDVIGRAHTLLEVMDAQPATRHFLVGNGATLADIAGCSYVSAAPEGNVDPMSYPNARAWLARVQTLPGFVPFQKTAVGLAA